jgi:hypothetical protein
MWVKKNIKDSLSGRTSPLPTQIVGNEEFAPMAQSADQQRTTGASH